jgi:hypothetical protein
VANYNITESQYNNLSFGIPANTNTNSFKYEQTQAVQFSANADSVWTISEPKLNHLIQVLNASLTFPNVASTQSLKLVLSGDMLRAQKQAQESFIRQDYELNQTTTSITQSLIEMLQCNQSG